MKRVQLESPYRGNNYENTEFNITYAHACVADCLSRGEAPFASHIMYTVATNDHIPEEREFGINAGFEFLSFADKSVVYIDLGISEGMKKGIDEAYSLGIEVEFRKLPEKKILELLAKHPALQEEHKDLKNIIINESNKLGKTLKQHFIDVVFESEQSWDMSIIYDNQIELTYPRYKLFINNEVGVVYYLSDDLEVLVSEEAKIVAKGYYDEYCKTMNHEFINQYSDLINIALKRLHK